MEEKVIGGLMRIWLGLIVLGLAILIWGLGFAAGHWVGREKCDVDMVYVVDTGKCVSESDHMEHVGE